MIRVPIIALAALASAAVSSAASADSLTNLAARVTAASSAIDAAISDKGVTTGSGLESAASRIAQIQTGATVTNLEVAANGVYTAPDGLAYSPVNVNVPTGGQYDGDTLIIVYDCASIAGANGTIAFSTSSFSGIIDWGDGSQTSAYSWSNYSHSYATGGKYTIEFKLSGSGTWDLNDFSFFFKPGIVEVKYPAGFIISGNSTSFRFYRYTTVHFNARGIRPTGSSPFFRENPDGTAYAAPMSVGDVVISSNLNLNRGTASRHSRFGAMHLLDSCTSVSAVGEYDSGNTYGLRRIVFDSPELTVNTRAFKGFPGLVSIIGAKLKFASADETFNGAESLMTIPDVLDFSECTTIGTTVFGGCTSLYRLPTNVVANADLSFAPCTGVTDRQSVIDMIGNINATESHTLTFNPAIYNLVSDVWDSLTATASAKGWTLAH